MNQIDAGGHRIAYERKGEGPPLVFLHGYVGDRRTWRRQIEDLSDEFTLVAWDAPGYGGSSDPPQAFRLPDFRPRLPKRAYCSLDHLRRSCMTISLVGAGPTRLSRFGRWSWAMPLSVERSAKP
jgi:pimeloyl-ACP methyl ester carboxylesterase